MSALTQKTIKKDISFKGVGLHSGLDVKITIKPAKPNTGILFKRIDIKENNIVIPNIFNVSSAVFCTTISNESGVSVSTIEHLMGALYGMSIDNALVEIDNKGMLAEKLFLDMNKMNKLNFSKNFTSMSYTQRSFVYSFLTSMRKKINDPLGMKNK